MALTCLYVINKADEIKPNAYTQVEKMAWLYELERDLAQIQADYIEEGGTQLVPADTDVTKNLIAGEYEEMYIYWLLTKIDFRNGDITRYNNDATLFEEAFRKFSSRYNMENTPIPAAKITY